MFPPLFRFCCAGIMLVKLTPNTDNTTPLTRDVWFIRSENMISINDMETSSNPEVTQTDEE